jgi:hypothetical protein
MFSADERGIEPTSSEREKSEDKEGNAQCSLESERARSVCP